LGFRTDIPFAGLPQRAKKALLYGHKTQIEVRYRNRPQPEGYIETSLALPIAAAAEPLRQLESESEPLSADVQLSERLMLGLRLAEGLDVEQAAAHTGAAMWTRARRQAATRLVARGRLLEQGPRLSIPKPAWLFSDGIIRELL